MEDEAMSEAADLGNDDLYLDMNVFDDDEVLKAAGAVVQLQNVEVPDVHAIIVRFKEYQYKNLDVHSQLLKAYESLADDFEQIQAENKNLKADFKLMKEQENELLESSFDKEFVPKVDIEVTQAELTFC
ncbi:hypothetical protein QVD17_08381 [Tagetes erecta]|uniref:Uncharacterized protein n=1 Tax=Tagetes erecta TaxID=13708 RepID=A0AAD8NXK9_TARER|nr:hypothetical protein QVD17_08381 [Tagetes erecta]